MSIIAGSSFLDALGWALLGSLLPFAIIALLYHVLVIVIKDLSAAARHNLALYGLLLGTGLFFYMLYAGYNDNQLAPKILVGLIKAPALISSFALQGISFIMPFAALIYLCYGIILFFQFGFFIKKAGSNRLGEGEKLPAQWRGFLQETAEQLGLPYRKIRAVCSLRVDTPQVIGFFKPIILIPFSCFTQLNTQQLEAVLLHEMVHIKRQDFAINLCISIIEILFFFNPFTKRLIKAIRIEREFCCDDMVLQFKYPAPAYAAALLTLERSRNGMLGLGISAAGKDNKQLLNRIERVLGKKKPSSGSRPALIFLLPFLLFSFIAINNADNNFKGSINQPNKIIPGPVSARAENKLVSNPKFQNTDELHNEFIYKKLHDLPKVKIVEIVLNELQQDIINSMQVKNVVESSIHLITNKEARDFSFLDQHMEADPSPELNTITPYVPSDNFDYQIIEDSSSPKIKSTTLEEKRAMEALASAKKGLDNINWKALENSLRNNKQDISMLKSEILAKLNQLNWKQINQEVEAGMAKSNLETLKELELQKQAYQQYQLQQSYLQAIQKKIMEQQQWMKENDERMKKAQKSLEQQQQQFQEAMKKRRIVYI